MDRVGRKDTKVVIRSRRSKKDRQHNDQKKKDRQHNDQTKKDRQHNDQKKKDRQHNDQKKKDRQHNDQKEKRTNNRHNATQKTDKSYYTNTTENRGWTQILRKGTLFMLHIENPSWYSWQEITNDH